MGKLRVNWNATQVLATKERLVLALQTARLANPHSSSLDLVSMVCKAEAHFVRDEMILNEFMTGLLILEESCSSTPFHSEDLKNGSRAFEECLRILNLSGIDHNRSALSFMFRDIYAAKSKLDLKFHGPGLAAWTAGLSEYAIYRPNESDFSKIALSKAVPLQRAGLCNQALELLLQIHDSDRSQVWTRTAIEAYWLSGDQKAAAELCEIASSRDQESNLWAILSRCVPENNWMPLINAIKKEQIPFVQIPKAYLWTYALKTPQIFSSLPPLTQIKRKYGVKILSDRDNGALLDAVTSLEESYDNSIPLLYRLSKLGDSLASRNHLTTLIEELLLLVAITRHAKRHSQPSLARISHGLYTQKSKETHSAPKNLGLDAPVYDPLGIAADLAEEFTTPSALETLLTAQQAGINANSLVRLGKIGKLATKSAGKLAFTRLGNIFRSDAAAQLRIEKSRFEIGQDALKVLGDLKGGFMKLGQIVSYAANASPETTIGLEHLQDRSSATDPRESLALIESELGKPLAELFSEWSEQPIAVGSIGQVFFAKMHNGMEVAVKVQHSQVKKALSNDLSAIALIKPILMSMLPNANHDALINEVRGQIMAETDYRREARNQDIFVNIFASDPQIHIPKIVSEYCSDHVLTMEFVRGQRFSEFCASSDQHARNSAASVFLKMFAVSFCNHRIFNADPHPGNYIFRDDGRISFIDFGCVKEFSADFVHYNIEIAKAVISGDRDSSRTAWKALGYADNAQDFDYDEMYKVFHQTYQLILEDKAFSFNASALSRVHKAQMNSKIKTQMSPPPESAMFIRFTWGLWSLLARLEPTLNFHALFKLGIESYNPEPKSDDEKIKSGNDRAS